jgi:hypothetical protein
MKGILAIGTTGFGVFRVKGRSLVPLPPASISDLITAFSYWEAIGKPWSDIDLLHPAGAGTFPRNRSKKTPPPRFYLPSLKSINQMVNSRVLFNVSERAAFHRADQRLLIDIKMCFFRLFRYAKFT